MRADSADDYTPPERILVTGFPAFTARRMIQKIIESDSQASLVLLARDKFVAEAEAFVATLGPEGHKRIEVLQGDVCSMDLGLSGHEFARLTREITMIQHLAGIYYMGVDRKTAERVNVEGTRGVLELAQECTHLRRLCHWSTASVSGRRRGTVMEDELDVGQSFHNFYEETKCAAERLARAAQRQLPLTIVRPGIIVGDSNTGEIDKFDGPYYLMVLIATNSSQLRVPIPGRGTAPLNLVPIDFVVDTAYSLSNDERAAGLTFHLTDPNPFSVRRVFELVAELSGTRLSRNFLPVGLTRTLMRAPGLHKLTRAPRSFFESLNQQVLYNCKNTQALLRGTGIACPPFDQYAPNIVRFLKSAQEARQEELEVEVFDPFD